MTWEGIVPRKPGKSFERFPRHDAPEFAPWPNKCEPRLTIHIQAAVAEVEANGISERTKAALAAAEARGTKLGDVM